MPSALRTLIRDARSIPLGIRLVTFVLLLRAIGVGFIDPFMPIYLSRFEGHYSFVALVMGLFSLGALLAAIPLARLSDHMQDTAILWHGEVMYLIAVGLYIASGLTLNIFLLAFTLFFNGVANSFVYVAAESYIRRHNPLGRSLPFGLYMAFDNLGWIIGMAIGGFFIEKTGFVWMWLWLIPSLFLSMMVFPYIHERGIRSILAALGRYFHRSRDLKDMLRDAQSLSPKTIFFFALAFFDGGMRMFAIIFIPLFAMSIHLSLPQTAWLMAVMYLPFVFSFFFSAAADHVRRMNMLSSGLFVGALAYILLYFIVDQKLVLLLVALTSVSIAMIRPVYSGAITQLTPRRMSGEVSGMSCIVDRLGRILVPVFTGVVADAFGIEITFLFMALFAFLLGAVSLGLRGYNHLAVPAE